MLSWFAIMPLDVVKSKWQADYRGQQYASLRQCVAAMYSHGGVRAFYCGWAVTAVRAFLVNSVTYAVYSWTIRAL